MLKIKSYPTAVMLIAMVAGLCACQPSQAADECADPIACVTIAPGDPIKLGSLQVLNTDITTVGLEQINSLELAIARRGGQILGHPVQVHSEDTHCSAEGGANAALKIVADPQVVAIVGTVCSSAATTASEIMSEEGLTMVSGINVAPSLTAINGSKGEYWQPGYFRTIPNSSLQAQALAIFVLDQLQLHRAAVLHDGDAFTQGLASAFQKEFSKMGGEVVVEIVINKGDTNLQPALSSAATFDAELIFMPLFQPEGIPAVQQAKQVPGLEDTVLIGADALLYQSFVDAVGVDGQGMYFVVASLNQAHNREQLIAEYTSAYDIAPSVFYPFVVDAVELLLDTIEQVAIQEDDGTLHIGRQALRDALYTTQDYSSITRQLDCDEFGDCGSAEFVVLRMDHPAEGIESLRNNVVFTIQIEP